MAAPKVTQQDVDNEIRTVEYIVLPDDRTTICMLTLVNGYTVRGESTCVHIDNFNPKTGQEISFRNAKDKVWPLLGFRLADKLHNDKTELRNELWQEVRDLPVSTNQSRLFPSVTNLSVNFRGKEYNYDLDVEDIHQPVTSEHIAQFLHHVVDEYIKAERGSD